MVRSVAADHEISILTRAVGPEANDWPPEIAKAVLSVALAKGDRERMSELAAKTRTGELTPAEEAEIETYRRIGLVLDLMRAKARFTLDQPPRRS